jgi:hypothetical protein
MILTMHDAFTIEDLDLEAKHIAREKPKTSKDI